MHGSCRFGNASESLLQALELQVHSQGPGPLQACWTNGSGHALCLTYSASCTGVFLLSDCNQCLVTLVAHSVTGAAMHYLACFAWVLHAAEANAPCVHTCRGVPGHHCGRQEQGGPAGQPLCAGRAAGRGSGRVQQRGVQRRREEGGRGRRRPHHLVCGRRRQIWQRHPGRRGHPAAEPCRTLTALEICTF